MSARVYSEKLATRRRVTSQLEGKSEADSSSWCLSTRRNHAYRLGTLSSCPAYIRVSLKVSPFIRAKLASSVERKMRRYSASWI